MKLYDEYAKLKKDRNRVNDRDKWNQEEFEGRLKNLFDIATSNALTTMKNEVDKQRNDVLSCSTAGVDVLLSAKGKQENCRTTATGIICRTRKGSSMCRGRSGI